VFVPVSTSVGLDGAIVVPAVEVSAPKVALSVVSAALMPEKLGKGLFVDACTRLGSGQGAGDGVQYPAGRWA
jgi:hypothetical protein